MNSHRPRVSIGMPVFNGEKYLEHAVNSILAQSYTDFELIIADDGSTDRTAEICQDYAARDPRVQYHRNAVNLGISRNYNRLFSLGTGEYFKWANQDDVLAPHYLQRCVEVLDQDPTVILCHSKTKRIDSRGEDLGSIDSKPSYLGSARPEIRFGYLLRTDRASAGEIFGVTRARVLASTGLYDEYPGTDAVVRAKLGLLGRFHEVPEYLFFFRKHALQSGPGWFHPARAGRFAFPHWRKLSDYWRCAGRAPVGAYGKVRCYLGVLKWVGTNGNWGRLGLDILVAANPRIWELYDRNRRRVGARAPERLPDEPA